MNKDVVIAGMVEIMIRQTDKSPEAALMVAVWAQAVKDALPKLNKEGDMVFDRSAFDYLMHSGNCLNDIGIEPSYGLMLLEESGL